MTLPGASAAVPCGWLAWLSGAALAVTLLGPRIGPAAAVIVVLAAGWALAHRAPAPLERWRRYHLDDVEVTAIGPGARVQRLPWAEVLTVTEERGALRLEGRDLGIRLPRAGFVGEGACAALLARVVSQLAEELWALIEDGEGVRLTPAVDPGLGALAWWGYAPALLACVAGAGAAGLGALIGAAAVERLVALLRAGAGVVMLDRRGVAFRRLGRLTLVPWADAEVVPTRRGLLVSARGGPRRLLSTRLPDFSAAVPVVTMRAQLGAHPGATVHFRVRLADGGPMVVGEVEPTA
jgi:hypothetical protein